MFLNDGSLQRLLVTSLATCWQRSHLKNVRVYKRYAWAPSFV